MLFHEINLLDNLFDGDRMLLKEFCLVDHLYSKVFTISCPQENITKCTFCDVALDRDIPGIESYLTIIHEI